MKKLFFMISMLCMVSVVGLAQESKWAAGVSFGYGSDISKPFVGVKAHYDIIEQLTIAPSFNYYFKDSEDLGYGESYDLNYWDINVDLHWNVLRGERFNIYPFVGFTYLHAKASYEGESESDGKAGGNIGVGGQFNIASNWAVGVEAKYQIIDGGQFVPMASVMYRF